MVDRCFFVMIMVVIDVKENGFSAQGKKKTKGEGFQYHVEFYGAIEIFSTR